jgi:hypothetical protein
LLFIVALQALFLLIRRPKPSPRITPAPKGRIAIVIDDWGYNLNNLGMLDGFRRPLTIAILPSLSYSRKISEALHGSGFEIILHLPMEPHEKYRLEKNTIMNSFDTATIRNIIEQDLANIRYAKGASNHMGSSVTENARAMEIILKELKKKHLYFLDSFVTNHSVGLRLAKKIGLGFAERDVFLDNTEEAGYIRKQIYKLKIKAKAYGQAIGIGHDRKVTIEVLKEVMPQLEAEGYKFVFVSELIK